jgi:uncharacterized protein (TIGR02722 family)
MRMWSSAKLRMMRTGALVLVALAPVACGGKRVSRIDPTSVTDLSGRWNDTDSRLVANQLITESLNGAWARRYSDTHGGESPAVIVGSFANQTLEHIPVNTFVNDLERAFVNSGSVKVVASKADRADVRDERNDQQENARADTRAKMAQELGAKYMLQGSIQAIQDSEGREKIVFYQIDATLLDLESNVKVWTGQHKIKKYIERPRISW